MRNPRPHLRLSLFSPRSTWACLRSATDSDSGSVSTTTSLLDPSPTPTNTSSSWTHVTRDGQHRSTDSGRTSSLDDVELIALINGDVSTRNDDVAAACGDDGQSDGARSWLYSRPERWHRSEVSPTSGLRWSTFSGEEEYSLGAASFNRNFTSGRLSGILAPQNSTDSGSLHNGLESLDRGQATLDRFPIIEGTNANPGTADDGDEDDECLTLEFLDRILRSIEAQLQQGADGFPSSGWHWQDLYHRPYPRAPTSRPIALPLLDSESRSTSDWSVITGSSSRQPTRRRRFERHSRDSDGVGSTRNGTLPWTDSGPGGGNMDSEVSPAGGASTASAALTGLFNNRSIYLPPSEGAEDCPNTRPDPLPLVPRPVSSHSSIRSTWSRGVFRPRQQNWYFYDPRLVSGRRPESRMGRSRAGSLVRPPAYDELMDTDAWELPGGPAADPPPPYRAILGEPPPTYDQSFEHMLAFDADSIPLYTPFDLSNTMVSSHNSQYTDSDLLNDVNIDELLGTTADQAASASGADDSVTSGHEDPPEGATDAVEPEPEDGATSTPSTTQGALPTSRYPVGFCLGSRPPVRWSRSTAPDRWASRQNWALQTPASGALH